MIEQVVAGMPKAENRYNAQFQYELWNAFEEGSDARARLLAEQGWRKVPSKKEIKDLLIDMGYLLANPARIANDLHRWWLEAE